MIMIAGVAGVVLLAYGINKLIEANLKVLDKDTKLVLLEAENHKLRTKNNDLHENLVTEKRLSSAIKSELVLEKKYCRSWEKKVLDLKSQLLENEKVFGDLENSNWKHRAKIDKLETELFELTHEFALVLNEVTEIDEVTLKKAKIHDYLLFESNREQRREFLKTGQFTFGGEI
ncbi:MAG: hypothetical protein ACRCX2_11840 [Paraclostridium sp.]